MTNIITKEQMDAIDALYRNPAERAEEINTILQLASKELDMDHSLMDITCFAIQWLSMLAVGELSGEEDFVTIARLANIWLYNRHYNDPQKIYGKPDKKEVSS